MSETRAAGPTDTKPDYTEIDKQYLNKTIMDAFRTKLEGETGIRSGKTGFDGIAEVALQANAKTKDLNKIHSQAVSVLLSFFPDGLLPVFRALFARPYPVFSNKINAWVTAFTCQWLMGKSAVNDAELPDGTVLEGRGVLIERCRYLEETGCASVCINSCKVPTQKFFKEHMGLPITMNPNYDDFSCQFIFGVDPPPVAQDEAFKTPCFNQCPTKNRKKLQNFVDSENNCHKVDTELIAKVGQN